MASAMNNGVADADNAAAAAQRAEEEKLSRLQRAAERVCTLILVTDIPAVDIAIERRQARELCQRLFPDRIDLFELIYESRFERLWRQFRTEPSWRDF